MRVDATISRWHLHYRLDDATRFASHTCKSANVTDLVPFCGVRRAQWVAVPSLPAVYYGVMSSTSVVAAAEVVSLAATPIELSQTRRFCQYDT